MHHVQTKAAVRWMATAFYVGAFALGSAACNGTGSTPSIFPNPFGTSPGGTTQTPSNPFLPLGGSGGVVSAPSSAGTSSGAGSTSQFCAALTVVRKNCQGCHGVQPTFGAPMSLETYEDFQALSALGSGKQVAQLVGERIHDTQRPMPPLPAALTPADMAAIDTWLAAGMPNGECAADTGEAPGQFQEEAFPSDCDQTYDLVTGSRTNPNAPYIVRANTEEHPQFTFDAPWGNDQVHVVAMRPVVDNIRVLHHWILYSGGGGFGGKFLVGWAAGQGGENMPDDVGMYMPTGANALRLDIHYYNLGNSQNEPDNSGVRLCVTRRLRPLTATTIGLTGNATVPAFQRVDNMSQCTASVAFGADVRLISVAPHMHKLGVNGKLELVRNGVVTVLHDAPFQFGEQRIYPLNKVQVLNGDILRTTCSYQNNTARTVRFGQNSDDEMCFNFTEYYPMGGLTCGFSL